MTAGDATQALARAVAEIPGVAAVSLGGSVATGLADAASDIDLHVYWRAPLAGDAERASVLARFADPGSVEAGILSWGLEDHLRIDGRLVELVYVAFDDLLADAARAYGEGLNGEGFVTAPLFYVAHGRPLANERGELTALRERLLAAYPEPTHRRLLRENPALLEEYLAQLRKAQARGDLLFVQHRRATVQMVFFNLLFALNRRYHPGEKRLLIHGERCATRPAAMAERWSRAARLAADDPALVTELASLCDELLALAGAAR